MAKWFSDRQMQHASKIAAAGIPSSGSLGDLDRIVHIGYEYAKEQIGLWKGKGCPNKNTL